MVLMFVIAEDAALELNTRLAPVVADLHLGRVPDNHMAHDCLVLVLEVVRHVL